MKGISLIWLLPGILCLIGSGYLFVKQRGIEQYNQKLELQNFVALEDDSVSGQFVKAWRHQIGGEFSEATTIYNQTLHQSSEDTANKIQFNLANIYMQQGIRNLTDSDETNDESAYPLIELSKHIYRKLLSEDQDLWPAKYNLEIAVKIAPDVLVTDVPEDILPERSPENRGVIEEYKKLP